MKKLCLILYLIMRDNIFPQVILLKWQEHLLLLLLFKNCNGGSSQRIKIKNNKKHSDWKRNKTVYFQEQNFKEPTKRLLELRTIGSKVAGHKIGKIN